MSMKTNTSKTIEKTSTALENKIQNTKDNLKTLAARARCGGDPILEVEVPTVPGSKDDVLYIGLNAVDFYFKRGTIAKMPLAVAEIAANTGNLGMGATAQVKQKRAEMKAKAAKKTAAKAEEKNEEKVEE